MSRSTLDMRPDPRRRPMFPSPSSVCHRRPMLSLSLPRRRAQSFQSRADKLSLASTVATRSLSSLSVHGFADPGVISPDGGNGSTVGIPTSCCCHLLLGVTPGVAGVCDRASKSDARSPGGSSTGPLHRLFGVEKASLCLDEDSVPASATRPSSNSSLVLLFAPLGAGGLKGGDVGSLNGLFIGRVRSVTSAEGGGVAEKRSPSIVCSARQLAISPTTGDCDRWRGSYRSNEGNFGRVALCGFGCATP